MQEPLNALCGNLEAVRKSSIRFDDGDLTEQIEWIAQNPDVLIEYEYVAPLFEFDARGKIQGVAAIACPL